MTTARESSKNTGRKFSASAMCGSAGPRISRGLTSLAAATLVQSGRRLVPFMDGTSKKIMRPSFSESPGNSGQDGLCAKTFRTPTLRTLLGRFERLGMVSSLSRPTVARLRASIERVSSLSVCLELKPGSATWLSPSACEGLARRSWKRKRPLRLLLHTDTGWTVETISFLKKGEESGFLEAKKESDFKDSLQVGQIAAYLNGLGLSYWAMPYQSPRRSGSGGES